MFSLQGLAPSQEILRRSVGHATAALGAGWSWLLQHRRRSPRPLQRLTNTGRTGAMSLRQRGSRMHSGLWFSWPATNEPQQVVDSAWHGGSIDFCNGRSKQGGNGGRERGERL